jgi:hypothetical protein
MADLTPGQFSVAVLRRLGIQPTAGAVQAMIGWQKAEGGHWHNTARYNPLNTTQPAPGAGNTGTQGNIKVYRSWDQGIDATVQTLKNGHYGAILNALKTGHAGAVAGAIGQTPWGTSGDLVRRTIMSTAAPGSIPSAPAAHSGGNTGGGTRTITTTTPGIDNRAERAQLVLSFLNQKHADPVAFALQARALGDVAPTSSTQTQNIPGSGGAGTSGQHSGGNVQPSGGDGTFKISGPNPGRLKPVLVSFAKKVAGVYGAPLVGKDGSTHSKYTVDGNVSQHWSGNATDIFEIGGKPARGETLLHAGRAALIAAGMPRAQAMKAGGGLYNVGSHQIIFLTMQGGNHYDHLHISAR